MKKLRNLILGKNGEQDVLTRKGTETFIYGAICFLFWSGTFIASLFDDSRLLKNLSSLLFALFLILSFLAGRYIFYAVTGRYETLSGVITDVKKSQGVFGRNQNAVICFLGEDGKSYQFQTRYRENLHVKDAWLTVYAAGVNEHFKKDGFIYLGTILLQKR